MRDMSFLTKLGEENEKNMNGINAGEYSSMPDQKAEPRQEDETALPAAAIEDMAAPAAAARHAAPEDPGVPKRYSGNSYGNTTYMSAAGDSRGGLRCSSAWVMTWA